jgi:hypothetical protein
VERADHPARTGGRSCQQVGSSLAVGSSTVERADHPARTGGMSCQQVGSVLTGGSLYSGVRRSSSLHRRKVLSTGRFFSRCWLLYSGAR